MMREWAAQHGKCACQRTVQQETTKFKAGTLPLNMYQAAPSDYPKEKIDLSQTLFSQLHHSATPVVDHEEGQEGTGNHVNDDNTETESQLEDDIQQDEYDTDSKCEDVIEDGDDDVRR